MSNDNFTETLILTGSNGFVGTAVLLRLLALSLRASNTGHTFPRLVLPLRRPLPDTHPALSHPAWPTNANPDTDSNNAAGASSAIIVLIVPDLHQAFSGPTSALAGYARAASTMIWCIGARYTDFPSHSIVDYVHMSHTLPLAAAKAFSDPHTNATAARSQKEKTLVLLSGAWVDRTEKAGQGWFTIEAITRDVKGRTERDVLALPGVRARIFRPAGITPAADSEIRGSIGGGVGITSGAGSASGGAGGGGIGGVLKCAMTGLMKHVVVQVDVVAAAMVHVALEGPGELQEKDTWENSEIISLGTEALKTTPSA
ncbi:hypothetical protein BOTBODRAFT_31268 [Botryobasidium botryosum FD-172 SS1]|uniref:Thioester reductase (TE) domain-containing protein n=1 Tax=Botryobasidium botryosum (strain FD-172 SS1) TaxID=930990 RepID=A0A067MW59_BOTB1|nr:hypothetical protein BOTBODRAFT_31268 [Botryobasidium botryosum FD-172 SS1]